MTSQPVPEWLRPDGGLMAADLDRLPGLPDHTELIDGGLVFISPQRVFHLLVIDLLKQELRAAKPGDLRVRSQMTVILGERTRVEPDVLVVTGDGPRGFDATGYTPEDVLLAVEVVSPESVDRDRDRKPQLYARSGIKHFWRVEEVDKKPVVYVYEIDPATKTYVLTGAHHDRLSLTVPFPIDAPLDLTDL